MQRSSERGAALISGGGSGIGAATARALAGKGYRVALIGRRAALVEALAAEIRAAGGQAIGLAGDVTEAEQVQALAKAAEAALGPIEVLVNNAGVGQLHRAWRTNEETIARLLGTNLAGPIRLTAALAPQMVQRRRGHIVTIGSVAAHAAMPGNSLYSAGKAGLRAWSKALGRELGPEGVQVSLIAPGYIRTPMTAGVRWFPMASPEVVARSVVRVLRRPQRELVIPGYYRLLVWAEWFVPGLMDIAARLAVRSTRRD